MDRDRSIEGEEDTMMRTQLIHRAVFYPQHTAECRATLSPERVSRWLPAAFAAIREYLSAHGVTQAGPPFARRTVVGEKVTIEAGYPVREPIAGDNYIRPSRLPQCSAAIAVHYGGQQSVAETYGAVRDWLAIHDYAEGGSAWEVYLADPAEHPDPDTWHTEVVVPYLAP